MSCTLVLRLRSKAKSKAAFDSLIGIWALMSGRTSARRLRIACTAQSNSMSARKAPT